MELISGISSNSGYLIVNGYGIAWATGLTQIGSTGAMYSTLYCPYPFSDYVANFYGGRLTDTNWRPVFFYNAANSVHFPSKNTVNIFPVYGDDTSVTDNQFEIWAMWIGRV